MTSPRSRLLAAAAALALASPAALAQGGGVPMLLEQAGFWRAQGQPARAVAALERALAAQPSHPDALAAASVAQLELGHVAEAEGYLARLRQAVPGDARVARVEEALRGAAPRTALDAVSRDAGMRALDAGETRRAAQAFEAALVRDPGDLASLGGLGVVRLRQGRAAEARDLLQRALAETGEGAARWEAALEEAAFAVELPEARRQLALGAMDAAEALLLRAARREAAGRAEAEALLGEIALRRGEAAEAEARFRAAFYRRPGLAAARDGLLDSLRRQNRIAEADALARQPAAAPRAEALRLEAARTEDPEAALALLREALAAVPAGHPAAPWARLDLARHLVRLGRAGEARALMEAGPAGAADFLQAASLLAEEEGRFADAIRLLERVPDRLRGGDQTRLLRSLRWQAEVASALARRPAERRGALLAIAARPDPTGEAALRAARALARLGDREGASEATRLALPADRGAAGTLRLALGTALADARLEREAGDLLRPLAADPALAPARRRQVAALLGPAALPPMAAVAPAPRPLPAEAGPRLFQGARDPRVAGRIAVAVLQRDPRNAEARLGAIEAALVLRDLPSAELLVAEGRLLNASDPRVSFAEAQLARVTGDRRRAQTALQLAADQRRAQIGPEAAPYRRTMLAGQAPALGQDQAGDGQGSSFVPLNDNPAGAAAGGVTPSQLRASDDPLLSEIGRQLAEVNQEGSGRVVPNFTFRARSGSSGLERLREYGGGVEAATPLPSIGGELSARVQAVNIDTGNLDPSLNNLRRFGSNAVVLPGFNGAATPDQQNALRPRDSSATGAALGIAYARSGATVDIGSTPLGFREQNILGGIELTPRLSESFQLRLRGERRSVTDSLLSWSGMRDAQSGLTFGGVVRNTFRGQLEYYSGRLGAYAGGGYSTINGRNVADNSRWEAGTGVSYALIRTPERELTTGVDVAFFAYDKNLRNFTLGQGGYFSPQTYIGASIPVDYRERIGNWAYRLGGSIGVAHFSEKREAVYPGNGGFQAILESQAAADPTISAFYPSQRETSVTYGARADVEYALTPTLRVGAAIRHDRSADFNETRGLVYARYRFDP